MMSSPFCKNILVFVLPKSLLNPRCLVPPEGRSRVVTTAGRDAVDVKSVRRATAVAGRDEPCERCAACRMIGAFCVRQNRVVLAPVAGAKFAEARRPDRADKTFNPRVTVTTRTRRRGEHGISRKTIARGMPGDFRCDRGDYARVPFHITHEAAGALDARHSLRPLFYWADSSCKTSGALCRGIAESL
jgi:hypothetical protein